MVDHYRIALTPISGGTLDEVTGCWDEDGVLDALRASTLGEKPFAGLAENENPDPLRSVVASLRSRWNVVALYERPYMDLEFWDSHAGLYESCFKQFRVACERLHFFSRQYPGDPSDSQDTEFAKQLCTLFVQGLSWPEIQDVLRARFDYREVRYRGYSVIRPVSSFVVSRTAIAFDERAGDQVPDAVPLLDLEKHGIPALRVAQDCRANLLNTTLTIRTPEFIQQDPHLGPCATASLWVATRSLGGDGPGTTRFPFSTITGQAIGAGDTTESTNNFYDPNAGNPGLTADEIRRAIGKTGCHAFEDNPAPTVQTRDEADRLRHVVFSFLDSGFPVLLGALSNSQSGHHIVAAVGYNMPDSKHIPSLRPASAFLSLEADSEESGISDRHYLLSSAVRLFYAHDDRYGPFNRVVLHDSPEEAQKTKKGFPRPELLIGRGNRERMALSKVILPIPRDVRSPVFGSLVDALQNFDESPYVETYADPVFVWRCVLLLGRDFKQSLVHRECDDVLRAWYATLHLAKYVWLLEFRVAKRDAVCSAYDINGARVDGEFLYDATVPHFELHRLSGRVADKCWCHRNGDVVLEAHALESLQPLSYGPAAPDN